MTLVLIILLIFVAIMFFILLVMGGWTIGTYNWFVNAKQNVKNQFSNIKTEYQRRLDLFYNIVQSVKSYKNFEKSALVEVIQARSQGFTGSPKKDIKTMGELDNLFSKLMVLFEKYPDLKAIQQHNKLFDEIRVTEDRINIARTDYNAVVRDYNVGVKSFPQSLVVGMFKFQDEEFYLNEFNSDAAPQINLE